VNPGHALRFTKGNPARGIDRKPVLPSAQDTAILRRTSLGFIMMTMVDGEPRYTYEDGTEVGLNRTTRDRSGQRHFDRLTKERWLLPDKGDSLFEGGPAQIYRVPARTVI
jgi:hypothetical protein